MTKPKTTEKTEAAKPPTRQPVPTERHLRHTFTTPENLENAKQLAEALNKTAQIDRDFERVKTDFKARLSVVEAETGRLRDMVSTGYEMRATKCEWRYDCPAPGRKSLWRLDTDELIESQEMSESDKQVEIRLEPGQPVGVMHTAPALDKPARTSRSGVVACEPDGDDITDPDSNKSTDR